MTEPVVVILQTFKRTDCALRTIAAARQYLRYPDLRWYIADDGSPEEHMAAVAEAAGVSIGHSARQGYGANANTAWEQADKIGALTFWLEDDWELTRPLDLYPYAALLMERDDIGMVRLGYLNPGLTGQTIAHDGRLYWSLGHEPHDHSQIAFTGHPSLRHRRYREAYGDYPTGLWPGETELVYAYQYRIGSGPAIVWPAEYPPQGCFAHIGSVKTETML